MTTRECRSAKRDQDLRAEAAATVARVLSAATLVEVLGAAAHECGKGAAPLEVYRRRLARQCHPDTWANAPAEDQARAHDAMARVNEAFAACAPRDAWRVHVMTVLRRGREACTKCKSEGATRRAKGFTGVEFFICNTCNGVGYVTKSVG